jgi:hypothetical protein
MKLSDRKALVVGYGVFEVFIAQKLAEEFREVRVYTPCEEAFPLLERQMIGEGVPGVKRIDNFEDDQDDIDLFVFPDYGFASKQEQLRKKGKRVFGAGNSEILEMDRLLFAKTLAERGLPVFKYRMVKGIDELREVLKKEKDLWIKLPTKVRGIMETFHHTEYKNSMTKLDELAHKLGGYRDTLDIMIVNPIPGVEIGCEKFLSNGDYAEIGLWGPEIKGVGYIGRFMPMADMPQALKKVDDGMVPVWKKHKVCGHISCEVRVGKDRKPYFTDPCQRFPSPPGETIPEAYKNFSQLVWAVAGGEKIKPEKAAEWVAEVCIYNPIGKTEWVPVDFSEKEFKRLKFRRLCKVENQFYCLPDKDAGDRICGAVGLGDTKEEAQFEALEACEQLKCEGKDYDKSVFEEADEVLEEAKKYGVEF